MEFLIEFLNPTSGLGFLMLTIAAMVVMGWIVNLVGFLLNDEHDIKE